MTLACEAQQNARREETLLQLCPYLREHKLLELNAVAGSLGVLPIRVQERISSGELPATRIGGKLYVRQEDLATYIGGFELPPPLLHAKAGATATCRLAATLEQLQDQLPQRLRRVHTGLLTALLTFARRVLEDLDRGRGDLAMVYLQGAARVLRDFECRDGPLSAELQQALTPPTFSTRALHDDAAEF